MAAANDFIHDKLDLETRQIRLLKVDPKTPVGGPMICKLEVFPVSKNTVYTALSYTWGPPPSTETILVNGAPFKVRQNLYDFLYMAWWMSMEQYFWIDQICIDQQNTEEKNHQIKLMGLIYHQAQGVLAWLGRHSRDSDHAIRFVKSVALSGDVNDCIRILENTYDGAPVLKAQYQHATTSFFARPYWGRLWVVQEMNLARSVSFYCGPTEFSLSELKRIIRDSLKLWEAPTINPDAMRLIIDSQDLIAMTAIPNDTETWASLKLLRAPLRNARTRLRSLVWLHCDAACVDPRDKIYGLLSLATDYGAALAEELLLDVDYNKTTAEVFWDFLTLVIVDHVKIETLEQSLSFTLWVCQWQKEWEKYGSRIMVAMGVQCTNFENRIVGIAQDEFRRRKVKFEAATTPPD
ncbi:heterokaryon incompatibility protein-domain-containing protein [Paraphoma chrysanthemicola]|uniref:Heterokaryon incompatibility protein-domain-containing protein n=1 Tax=Paraphoma chrysanthemicola TaxID=798071 RepID=A0A8K0W195_9PLEO|nr:heterokaryon incompatibility protein-domain-containing protein [Paraphoma chrysanthemicola]